jgi:hypothetical protein
LAPPASCFRLASQLENVLRESGVHDDDNLAFPYGYLTGHFQVCAVVFSANSIDISPIFLPTLDIPIFRNDDVRRVYLSATLKYKADFARAFGKDPVVVEPASDAGNGERLVLMASGLSDPAKFHDAVGTLARRHNVLIAVPSYGKADDWKSIAQAPKKSEFTAALNAF